SLFLALSAAAVQVRLYRVGHDRNPNAPIRAMRNFTPPLVGPVRVANFTVWSFPHAGAIFLLSAWALSLAGAAHSEKASPTAGFIGGRAAARHLWQKDVA